MRFGDYIRDVRRRLDWTQPEAAREIGIEQSYLSKLETGKSYPAEDVFSSIIQRYDIDLSELSGALFASELDRLRDVTQMRAFILNRERAQANRLRRMIYLGIGCLALGGACLGAATLAQDKDVTLYQYSSQMSLSEQDSNQTEYRLLEDYRDVVFSEGERNWRLIGSATRTDRSPLRWFIIPGMALIFGAIGLFFASYRLR